MAVARQPGQYFGGTSEHPPTARHSIPASRDRQIMAAGRLREASTQWLVCLTLRTSTLKALSSRDMDLAGAGHPDTEDIRHTA